MRWRSRFPDTDGNFGYSEHCSASHKCILPEPAEEEGWAAPGITDSLTICTNLSLHGSESPAGCTEYHDPSGIHDNFNAVSPGASVIVSLACHPIKGLA